MIQVIKDADVLLLVLDSRFVKETRNREIEDKIKRLGKPLIYVLTKCDLIDQRVSEQQAKQLDPAVFVSAKKYFGTTMLKECIIIEAKRAGIKKRPMNVGVLGYPNVGKSSLINAMTGRGSAPTSILSGRTKGVQKVRSDKRIMFLDTPGVLPYREKSILKHTYIGTIDFNSSKEPDVAVIGLMEKFPGLLEAYYGVEVKEDKEETLEDIAVKRNIIKKGRQPDLMRMARLMLKDWQKGDIKI